MQSQGHPSGFREDPGFAPEDLTDGHAPGEWRSKYEPEAWTFIWIDAGYLTALMIAGLGMMLLVWLHRPQSWLHLSVSDTTTFSRFAYAGLSGMLGGVVFAMKWLYHSVAKSSWHMDRRLWRYLTPLISGCIGFFMIAVVQSVPAFDPKIVSTGPRVAAFGFLIGLFSDNAIAKLAEVAETLLGRTRRASDNKPESKSPPKVAGEDSHKNAEHL